MSITHLVVIKAQFDGEEVSLASLSSERGYITSVSSKVKYNAMMTKPIRTVANEPQYQFLEKGADFAHLTPWLSIGYRVLFLEIGCTRYHKSVWL